LFIECLPSSHSLIEQFKKDHRMIDVKKAKSEVRELELENLRRAARILGADYADPKIDKRILVQGTAAQCYRPSRPMRALDHGLPGSLT
jgi:hypothetical protein